MLLHLNSAKLKHLLKTLGSKVLACTNNYFLQFFTKERQSAKLTPESMMFLCTELTQLPLMPSGLMPDGSQETLKNEGPGECRDGTSEHTPGFPMQNILKVFLWLPGKLRW